MMTETLVSCARCGRTIQLSASSEVGLVEAGVMVEFYHCADREACEAAKEERQTAYNKRFQEAQAEFNRA